MGMLLWILIFNFGMGGLIGGRIVVRLFCECLELSVMWYEGGMEENIVRRGFVWRW